MHAIRTTLACALVAGAAVIGAPAATAAASATPAPATDTVITLVTGDRIAVTNRNGKLVGNPLDNGKSGFHEFQGANGDQYLIPATAQPYLGHGLDQSLFDLTALVRNGDTGQIPVNLSFTGTPAAPAGVTLTSVTGQTAAGYLTAGSAADFGAALRQRIGADVTAGHAAGTTAAFPGLAAISLTGAAQPPAVTPDYQLNRVEVHATDLAGNPTSNGTVFLANTTAFSQLMAFLPLTNGVGKVEAPAGTYMLVAEFSDFDASGNVTAERQVILEGLTVTAGSGITTFSVSEAAANLPVTVSTPRPSATARVSDMYARTDTTGRQEVFGILANNGVQTFVNASTPTTGSGYMFLSWFGTAPDGSYVYSVAFNDKTGMPADENFVVRPDQLATVAERLYETSGTTGQGSFTADAADPVLGQYNAVGAVVNWGQVLTHYVGTADGGNWTLGGFSAASVLLDGPPQTFTGGRNYTIDWGKEPLAPSLNSQNGDSISCAACVAGSTFTLSDDYVGDSDPTHYGYPDRPKSATFTLYQGDTKVASGSSADASLTGIPLTHTTYREVLDQDYTGVNGYSLATTTHTERTFSYDPDDPALTTQYACTGWTATTACQVLPVLSATYNLAGLDLTGTSTDRSQRLDLGIDHLSYNGTGSTSPITAVTVSVSFDGTHWQQVPVSGRNGHYTACWPNAAAGTRPAIQVTAKDAAGNALSQTVTNAYLIGATQ